MNPARLPLRHRLLLTVLLPVTLLVAAMAGLFLHRGERMTQDAIVERGVAIVSFFAPAAEYGVISGNPGILDGLLQALVTQPDVVAVAVYERGGELIASHGEARLLEPARVKSVRQPSRLEQRDGRKGFAAPVMSVPLVVDEIGVQEAAGVPGPVGWVYVELDTSELDAEWRSTMLTTLGLALVTLLFAALLATRLANQVGRPVARLVDAVRRMAAGDLDVQVPDHAGSEELRELQLGFNSMARSIGSAHKLMQAKIDEATARLAHQALHDPLTALPNRRAFEQALEEMVAASRRADDRGALCFIDLDHFKAVNDTAGHAAGDALLRTVADLIRQRLRAEDIVCRIGGDEFAMILRGCTSADAYRIADGLCEAVRELRFMWEGREFRIGASIGFAIIDGTMESVAEVLHAADHACYAVKREGRGRVMEYLPEPPASPAG
ncbi:MAG: diguanylate cyclase [Thauera propionica]|jgi:diguanylate cyclase (GGDEF)-like protein|uniref:diguanylate cyclase n=1 Tax=Thauera propionica TaxID=2019431 RepID=UPI0023F1C332|nr:diguanylate cyclase [Thauera propionica]MDD3674007.1 diguanylate cyclase [Thauera propionica]MDY0048364.1 diguanylate cyclase [Thauera propionica]